MYYKSEFKMQNLKRRAEFIGGAFLFAAIVISAMIAPVVL